MTIKCQPLFFILKDYYMLLQYKLGWLLFKHVLLFVIYVFQSYLMPDFSVQSALCTVYTYLHGRLLFPWALLHGLPAPPREMWTPRSVKEKNRGILKIHSKYLTVSMSAYFSACLIKCQHVWLLCLSPWKTVNHGMKIYLSPWITVSLTENVSVSLINCQPLWRFVCLPH